MKHNLRKSILMLGVAVVAFPSLTGCMEAERKLGRGINNVTEFARLGELSRSVEQSTLMDGPAVGRTTGFIHGINRSIGRTAVGAFEILTFPLPSDPYIKPVNPVYPDSYHPRQAASPMIETDTALGFDNQGDHGTIFPGSRLHVFD